MNVEVSEWARARIAEMVASSRARNEREAIDAALAAWSADDHAVSEFFEGRSDEWWAELDRSLGAACAELDARGGIPVTQELIEHIKQRGRERLRTEANHSA